MSAVQISSDAPDARVDSASPLRNELFDFMGLPGEIRNMIYPLLLEGRSQQHYSSTGYTSTWPIYPIKRPIKGLWMPFTHWEFRHKGNTDTLFGAPEEPDSRTLMEAPAILAVNKQVRAEARSLYLRKHLTLELHGIGAVWDDKLKSLRYWLESLTSEEVASIERLELREHVLIIRPEHADEVREWVRTANYPMKTPRYWEPGTWEYEASLAQIAAVELVIKDGGRILELWSRLEIVEKERAPVTSHVKGMEDEKRQMGAVFTGHDLIALTCWLKVTDDIPRRITRCYQGAEEYTHRWIMLGSDAEIKWPEPSYAWPGHRLKLGFRHLIARADVSR